MAKATHSGTCQCCGRHQKLPSGKLSKHGYTVQWGYFDGVCDGAGYEPLEVSCDRIPVYIKRLEGFLENREAFLKDLNEGKQVNFYYDTRDYNLRRTNESVTVDFDQLEQEWEDKDEDGWYHVNFYYTGSTWYKDEDGKRAQKEIRVKAGYGFDKTKKAAIKDFTKKSNSTIIWRTERTISEVKDAIAERKEILENWKPRPELLVEVDKKANQPIVHLAGGWTDTAHCVASRMGAQRFNGHTTDDVSKVTCKKCLKRIEELKAEGKL